MKQENINDFKKPVFLNTLFASIEANFVKPQTQAQKSKKKINDYSLVTEVNKNGKLQNFAIGIYQNKKNKYFVKTWNKNKKDLAYYSAFNEFKMTQILSNNLKKAKLNVRVPSAIEIIRGGDNSISFIYEYVEGKDLSDFSKNDQITVLKKVLNALEVATGQLSESEKNLINKRGVTFYLMSLPLLAMISIRANKKNWKEIIKATLNCYISFTGENELVLAHRDLHPGNIKVSGNITYLLDCEDMVLTLNGFDSSDLKIVSRFAWNDKKNFNDNFKNSQLLINYIAIHRSGNLLRENHYMKYLLDK